MFNPPPKDRRIYLDPEQIDGKLTPANNGLDFLVFIPERGRYFTLLPTPLDEIDGGEIRDYYDPEENEALEHCA